MNPVATNVSTRMLFKNICLNNSLDNTLQNNRYVPHAVLDTEDIRGKKKQTKITFREISSKKQQLIK